MSAHLVKNSSAVHAVEDDLKSGLYIILWTALKYRESYMSVIDQTQFILQIFDADLLVGTGGSAKSDWLVARTYFLCDIFIGCKPLDNLVVELAQFFSHRYSSVSPEAQESLVRLWLSLQEVLDEAGSVRTAAQQKMIDVVQRCLLESSAYQKEIGMQVLHSHKAVINIYNKHLGSSGWPDKDMAVLQKMHPTNKQSGHCLYTKSLCTSQDVTSARVQVTPSGKKCRLDPEEYFASLYSSYTYTYNMYYQLAACLVEHLYADRMGESSNWWIFQKRRFMNCELLHARNWQLIW
ncbi:uncharacterized protein F5891DRAFT_979116 [Suillus fuscotomentosus]|uniref:Uncharacterized protein n=1 Tax=Suillus fuscotomentosus TaxID=1912939 RepID=A0AAD4E940_9AGAM|nr:uncharacterized protein F5891DRAFT_979116 [Suillus fuscotomentosus]KAG1902003.1 hypothetical protein F5891DRAFT_979116 [Suillus fuscotomentosus]